MKSNEDLRPILDQWEYSQGQNVRRVQTDGGREVLQVRLPLGIEQYELNGRPDGLRPDAAESWYEIYRGEAEDSPWDFSLEAEAFERLKDECMLYYHRYLLFFQISEYQLCARDTERNLGVLDFVKRYAEPKSSETLEQYRPYIIRMNVMARALEMIQDEGDVDQAMELIREGIESIEGLPPIENNSIFSLEKTRSLGSLEDLLGQLESYRPKSESEDLNEQLEAAISEENYEEAARLRDEIARVESESESTQTRSERG